MDNIDTSLVVQAGIYGTVGVLMAVKLITSYLKKLINIAGRWSMVITLLVSLYAVATMMLAVLYPTLSYIFMGVYLTVLVAGQADAVYQQEVKQKDANVPIAYDV